MSKTLSVPRVPVVSILALVAPFIGILIYCIKTYGTIDFEQYKGIGVLKLLGVVAWFLHLVILIIFGEELFCENCSDLEDIEFHFILPSVGYGLIAFPQVASAYAPSEISAKTIESGAVLSGSLILLYVYIFM